MAHLYSESAGLESHAPWCSWWAWQWPAPLLGELREEPVRHLGPRHLNAHHEHPHDLTCKRRPTEGWQSILSIAISGDLYRMFRNYIFPFLLLSVNYMPGPEDTKWKGIVWVFRLLCLLEDLYIPLMAVYTKKTVDRVFNSWGRSERLHRNCSYKT